ncbi:TonB-dependent receptor [Bradyrhizobium sp. Pha-3]|uniref:TonB-dependent receptor n=1 Tax=Bradyrhizobium sp. Pha-3 TaxID=208375 RepID=UPI0035D3EAFF
MRSAKRSGGARKTKPTHTRVSNHAERSIGEANRNITALDPLFVTARKTNERLQDVPESITVVSPEHLSTNPFEPGAVIAGNSPNVQWVNTSPATRFFSIRGVSTLGSPQSFSDGTVGFNIDGVPNSMMSASNVLLDVNRVEVIRGPQGTLWGTNALGGAINVVTNQPDGTRDVRFTSEAGSNNYGMGEAIIGGNIVPGTLDGRMAVRFGHRGGDINSLFTNDLAKDDVAAFRGGLRFTGLDNTTITLTGTYLNDRGNAPWYLLRDAPGFPISGVLSEPSSKRTQAGTTLKIVHDFDAFTLTSISAYQRNELRIRNDPTDKLVYDQIGLPSFPSIGRTTDQENMLSQEFRLSSLEGDPIRWVIGASAVRTEGSRTCDALQCAMPPIITKNAINSTNLGLFGDVTIPFADRWEVSAGGRISYDDIEDKFSNSLNVPGLTGYNNTHQEYPTGRLALAYKWTDDIRTYVSVARGHSSRIYSLLPQVVNGVLPDPFPAATGWTYEAGVKASLLDRRLEIETSLYHNDIKNGLLAYLDPQALAFKQTYQDYETSGFELQARARITDSLSFIGGVGYTHGSLGANGAHYATVKGNRAPNTPDWAFTTALQYDAPGAMLHLPGAFSFNVQYQYTGRRAADAEDSFDLKPYHILNARIGWKNDGGDFEAYVFGRNLLDQRYEAFGATLLGVSTVNVGQGRIAGVGLTKIF